ncbi:MAG: CBS domain-containing protein [Methanobrevibacter sp.]|nr:CBS domain-containing protein [Candidatus Methanoflexus mossambicus]
MLKNLKVKDQMTTNVITSSSEEDVVFAFEKLMKKKISSLPVVDDENKIIGIITASDLGHNLILDNYNLGTKVKSVMVKEVKTIDIDSTLQDAVNKMGEDSNENGIINQLPVVDDGKLLGILSDGDILRALKE